MQQVTHVFWPSTLRSGLGNLVGWRCGSVVCVATCISNSDDSAARIAQAHDPALGIIGTLRSDAAADAIATSHSGLLFTLDDGVPRPRSPPSPSEPLVIMYDPPSISSHHFFSLSPLLDALAPMDDDEKIELAKTEAMAMRMRDLTLVGGKGKQREQDVDVVQTVVDCINRSEEVHDLIMNTTSSSHSDVSSAPSTPSSSSAFFFAAVPNIAPLLSRSAFAQQLMTRATQVSTWPGKYRIIWRPSQTPLSSRRAQYVRLFSTLWLIANDISIGICQSLEVYAVDVPIRLLRWMNSYPAGLKLNDELGRAFCESSVQAIELWWHHVLGPLTTYLPGALFAAGAASSLGAAFALAASADLLSLATLHLWVVYRGMTFVFGWHLRVLGVLFDIFRGQKFNVLRDRREPATYDLDQLILGTIFFTLASFLFPTVLAFYLLCGASRLAIISAQAAIETGLALLNHFPLFAVLLRIKDPARLPAGVRLRPFSEHHPDVLKIESVPVDLGWIFSDYISLARKLTAHYSPLHLFGQLLCGTPIQPLARHDLYTYTA